ncbi:MAG: GGDEF domain-containing protein [bacterium]
MTDDTDIASARESAGETVIGSISEIHAKIGKNLPFLSIIYPQNKKNLFKVTEEPQVIGRGETASVVLDDDMASRAHCEFWLENEGVFVRDLGSTNGTLIDNALIETAQLTQESRLLIGDHILKLEYKNEHELEYDKKLIQAATTDALTGIANRRTLMDRARELYNQCLSNDRSLALVMLDIDHFKRVNDNWGHPAGDLVIKRVAQLLAAQCSSADICGRYGGEEFMVLLPDRSKTSVVDFCEGLRKQVEDFVFSWGGENIPVTISLGASIGEGRELPGLEQSVSQADDALYQAKEGGRNRLVCERVSPQSA